MTSKELAVIELTEESVESMVYQIREQKVMLDFDLARIYGYTTKAFNQQVQRNIEKFPEDFMFRLTMSEVEQLSRCNFCTTKNSSTISEEALRCKNYTLKNGSSESEDLVMSQIVTSRKDNYFVGNMGGTRKLPYAFTEQGIYMLMTVLKGELAVKQSKALIRLFKGMKDYIGEIASNPYNNIVNNKRFAIQREFERIVENEDRIGYLVINNFRVSKEIAEKLGVDNKMALLMSKGKLISISKDHGITGEQFADVIKKATYSPEAIVYDRERKSFQFYAKLDDDAYRTVIEFGAIPKGMKNVKADILTTLFKNQYYEKRIESIKDHKFPELILRYEKRSGWALIATDSSNQNISNDKNDVKE